MSRNATPAIPYGTLPGRLSGAPRKSPVPIRPLPGEATRPLVFDLDGALLRTDTLFEGVVAALRLNPLMIFTLFLWLLQGRAVLKARLAAYAPLEAANLPVDQRLVALGEAAAAAGRPVVLATAADISIAQSVARRFPFITRVMASDGSVNLKGSAKAAALKAAYPDGFDYAGDSAADLAVFAVAENIVLVRASASVIARASALGKPMQIIEATAPGLKVWARALRIKQWAKNALIFAPIPLAGALLNPHAWRAGVLAFLGLGLVASATYLVNDLVDLPNDRQHWSKRERPLASGALPILHALIAAPILLLLGFVVLGTVSVSVVAVGMLYVVATLAYSLGLKKVPVVDVAMLASLFTLRLFLGVVAVGVVLSPWLFVFSMALFLSLSTAKRHTELTRARAQGKEMQGRGYQAADEPLLLAMGLAAVATSVLILILYLMAEGFRAGQYQAPGFLWAAPAIIFLWQMRIWLLSQRGLLDDDPVAFAMRDHTSLQLGAALVIAFLAAHFGAVLPWL